MYIDTFISKFMLYNQENQLYYGNFTFPLCLPEIAFIFHSLQTFRLLYHETNTNKTYVIYDHSIKTYL